MKILLMFLVYSVKKTVRKLLQGRVILHGRYGKWIEGLCWDTEKTLDFFLGGVG